MTTVFYKEREQLYLETDVVHVRMEANFLHVTAQMQLQRNETPNNAVLQTTALASKSLTSM